MDDITSEPAPTYLQLREHILNLDPQTLGLDPSATNRVWGVVIETGYEAGTASLAVLEDGTTSLFYSTGGALVGNPGYAPLAQAAKNMVAEADRLTGQTAHVEKIDLPSLGQVRFIFLTFSGKLTTHAAEKRLAAGEHAFSQLYQLGRETIKQIRLLQDKKRS